MEYPVLGLGLGTTPPPAVSPGCPEGRVQVFICRWGWGLLMQSTVGLNPSGPVFFLLWGFVLFCLFFEQTPLFWEKVD